MPQFLKDYGERLVGLGYCVVPIAPNTKRPDLKNWPNHETTQADVVKWYSNGRSHHGAGINARHTPAIDVDICDEQAAQEMSDAIDLIFADQQLMTRTGRAPKFLIPFRSDEPFRKLTSHTYTDGKHDHKIEILGDGQQWVAYHIHPDTERPYQWFDGSTDSGIARVAHADLPTLTRSDAQRVIDAFEVLATTRVQDGAWVRKTNTMVERKADVSGTREDPFAAYAEPTDLTLKQVEWVISRIANDESDYDRWFSVLCAIHHQLGDAGLELARSFSEKSSKHDTEVFEAKYASLGAYYGPMATLRSFLSETGQPPKADEPTEADKNFRFYPGDQYAVDFNAAPEIVEDVFPDRGVAMVYGASGKGKTFWMLDLAFHVHNHIKWRDKDVQGGDVMYVAAEAGRGIKKRIHAVKRVHPDWRAPFVADIAPDLASAISLEAVRDAALAVGKPVIIVIDTMSASFEGDDSSQQDVAKMMRNLKTLSDALECLVVFVHHTTKDGGSYRGSGVLFANVDAVLELISEEENGVRKQYMVQRKHREGEDGKTYPFSLAVSDPLAHKPNGKPITSCTIEHEYYETGKPRKDGKTDDFHTAPKYAKLLHVLNIIKEEVGIGDANIEEADVIKAIQDDETVNPLKEPDYPKASNIKRQLLTLAEKGKIRREGRWIKVCE